jgi:hypothetical protein
VFAETEICVERGIISLSRISVLHGISEGWQKILGNIFTVLKTSFQLDI